MASPDEIFDRVLSYCGFTDVLGPGILVRALTDEGVDKQSATVNDYRRAVPRIEARMKAYLDADEVAHRLRRIMGYLAFVDGEIDEDDERVFSRIGRAHAADKGPMGASGKKGSRELTPAAGTRLAPGPKPRPPRGG